MAEIDPRWAAEWIEFGLNQLSEYLAKWARFHDLYPEPKEQNESPGNPP